MIPTTEYTTMAVAALIYNHAYNQDPDTGWLADDKHSAPGGARYWQEWSSCLIQALQEHPEFTDEQVISLAELRAGRTLGYGWNTIWMHQTEDGDEYSTITEETAVALPLVRHFLEEPMNYPEARFIEDDPVYIAYLESPA